MKASYFVTFQFTCCETNIGDSLVLMGDWLDWNEEKAAYGWTVFSRVELSNKRARGRASVQVAHSQSKTQSESGSFCKKTASLMFSATVDRRARSAQSHDRTKRKSLVHRKRPASDAGVSCRSTATVQSVGGLCLTQKVQQ